MEIWSLVAADDAPRDHKADEVRDMFPPVRRGYWFDEEVCRVSGINSASVLKKLTMCGAAIASYVGTKPKGRRRAWTARNVFRVMLVARLADATRLSYIAAAAVIEACGLSRLERLIGIDPLLEKAEESRRRQLERLALDVAISDVAIPRSLGAASLRVVNGDHVCWSINESDTELLAKIQNAHSTNPSVRPILRQQELPATRTFAGVMVRPLICDFLQSI